MSFWADGPLRPNNHGPRIHPWFSKTPTPDSLAPVAVSPCTRSFDRVQGETATGLWRRLRPTPMDESKGYDCGARVTGANAPVVVSSSSGHNEHRSRFLHWHGFRLANIQTPGPASAPVFSSRPEQGVCAGETSTRRSTLPARRPAPQGALGYQAREPCATRKDVPPARAQQPARRARCWPWFR